MEKNHKLIKTKQIRLQTTTNNLVQNQSINMGILGKACCIVTSVIGVACVAGGFVTLYFFVIEDEDNDNSSEIDDCEDCEDAFKDPTYSQVVHWGSEFDLAYEDKDRKTTESEFEQYVCEYGTAKDKVCTDGLFNSAWIGIFYKGFFSTADFNKDKMLSKDEWIHTMSWLENLKLMPESPEIVTLPTPLEKTNAEEG